GPAGGADPARLGSAAAESGLRGRPGHCAGPSLCISQSRIPASTGTGGRPVSMPAAPTERIRRAREGPMRLRLLAVASFTALSLASTPSPAATTVELAMWQQEEAGIGTWWKEVIAAFEA